MKSPEGPACPLLMEISFHSLLMEISLHVSWERDGQGVGKGGETRPEMGMKIRKGSVLWSFGKDTGVVGSQCHPGGKGKFWDTV